MIRIIVAGFPGAMAQKVVALIQRTPDFALAAVFNPHRHAAVALPARTPWCTDLATLPPADVWVDFSTPQAVFGNVQAALNAGLHPVVGTSGMTPAQQETLQALAAKRQCGGLIAPNFGLSAVLLMQFARQAAAYFPQAEVIEMHHADKKDAPSGTAIATAHAIAAGRQTASQARVDQPARGQAVDGVPIHAVRLPGYVAHEQVLFGGPGEALTIRQDSFTRDSFMSGVALAVRRVDTLTTLAIGLEHVL